MTPEMQRSLVALSSFFHLEPAAVFRRVLETVSAQYGGAMAAITLNRDGRLYYREAVNPHPLLARLGSVPYESSYCQFAIGPRCPTLIQDAAADPALRSHPAVRLGLTRYLGVPVCWPDGSTLGTLCFMDGRSAELVGEADVEFLALLAMRVSAEMERERLIEERIAEERETAARLAELNRQLEATAEEKRRFVATVIHDLRQPLTTLRTTLHLLDREEDPAERAECLRAVEGRVGALSGLVEELMEYAAIEAGRVMWRMEAVDPADVVAVCVEELREEAELAGVRLTLDCKTRAGQCRTDRSKLAHVVRNLLSNAVKFSVLRAAEEGPDFQARVAVRVEGLGAEGWRLEVEDNGIGIREEALPYVWDEFYTAEQMDAQAAPAGTLPGRGLGLAIVRHLSAAIDAELSMRSEPGRGTFVTIRFPHLAAATVPA